MTLKRLAVILWCSAALWLLLGKIEGLSNALDLWREVLPPYVRSVRFVDPLHGWLAGLRGLYYTADGGRHWTKLEAKVADVSRFTTSAAGENIGTILWADDSAAVVQGDKDLLFGDLQSNRWFHSTYPKDGKEGVVCAFFPKRQTGWAAQLSGGVLLTENGGLSWRRVRRDGRREVVHAIWARSAREAWVVGLWGLVASTKDGGATWTTPVMPEQDYVSIAFTDDKMGWLAGASGQLYKTSDGGASWVPQGKPLAAQVSSSSFVGREGWVLGFTTTHLGSQTPPRRDFSVFHTCDWGNNWSSTPVPVRDRFVQVQGMVDGTAWVVGKSGSVLRLLNHGKEWEEVRIAW